MADLSDMLNSSDPQSLQRLLVLRDQLSPQQFTQADINSATANPPISSGPSAMVLPYGGLEGSALNQYIQQNPGPQAIIGLNPNAKQDLIDDQDESEESNASSPTHSKASSSQENDNDVSPVAVVSKPSSGDILGNLMNRLYGPNAQNNLTAAQQAQQQIMSGNALNMAGKEIAAAMSRGGYKPDYASNQAVAATASLPVQQQIQQRAAVKDAVDSGMRLQDFQNKQQLNDADSPISQAYRSMAAVYSPQLKNSPNFDNMTAQTIMSAQPMIDAAARMQYMQLMRQQMFQQRADQRQQQAFNQTVQQLESTRTSSPAVQQAEKDIYSAQKAQSLSNLYGDPNNLSPQMTSLLTEEVAKIAQGGVPTHEELGTLTPGTLHGALAGVYSKLVNDPTPANAGAFIKQYQDYTQAVAKDAQKVIQDRYNRVIGTRASQFTPDQNQYLKDNYLNRFKSATESFSPSQEAGINAFMQGNGITDRDQAVQILKNAGKL